MTSFTFYRQNTKALRLCLIALLAALVTTLPTAASAENPSPPQAALQHGPISSTPAGKSVPVSVTMANADEIIEVRLYFKTMAVTNYFFLPMTGTGKGLFTASLPPAKNDTKGIDYLLLFKNSRGETRKTKPFRLLVLNDYSTPSPLPDEFLVQTEQSAPEVENRDFAIPFKLAATPEPLLAYAVEDPYPPQQVTSSPHSNKNVFSGLSEFGGIAFSIKIGGVGFFYKGFSGH